MKKIILLILVLFTIQLCFGQSLNDVVNNSYRSKSEQIFISDDSKIIFFGDSRKELKDSMLIQTEKHYELYLQAYNPLLKSHAFESKLIDDELQVALDKALEGITSNLTTFFFEIMKIDSAQGGNPESIFENNDEKSCGCKCDAFTSKYGLFFDKEKELNKNIESLTKGDFIDRLAKLDFSDRSKIIDSVRNIQQEFMDYQESIMLKKSDLEGLIGDDEVACDETYTYLLKDYKLKLIGQLKDLEDKIAAIDKVISSVSDKVTEWSKPGMFIEKGGFWYFHIASADHQRGKSVSAVLTMKEHHELKNGTLTLKEKEATSTYRFHLRKYRLLLPEVSTGIIYTSIVTPTYALGEGNVLERTNDNSLEGFKFSQMINANLNLGNGGVLPFIQGGVALNTDIPVGIIGAGIRLRTTSKNGIALAFGCAMTGVKTLRTFEEGQVVSDDATLQNDLKYDFIAKPYIGIQFNF